MCLREWLSYFVAVNTQFEINKLGLSQKKN